MKVLTMPKVGIVILLSLVLSGCSNPTPVSQEESQASQEESQEVDSLSGTLQVALISDVQSFDPFSRAAPQWPIVQNIYDTLVRYTSDQVAIPGLASAWEFAPDNASVTLTIQPNAKWHSGNPVTAEDIVANFNRAMVEETGANMFPLTRPIQSVEVADGRNVLIKFSSSIPNQAATDIFQQLAMIEPDYFDRLANEASGSGPFKLGSWSPGIGMTLVANEDYWGEGPFLESIEFTIYSDVDAMVAALQGGGTVDIAMGVPAKDAGSLAEYDVSLGAPGSLVLDLRLNTVVAPFDNKTVRQALSWHAVDREGIVSAVLFGQSVPALTFFDAGPFADKNLGTSKAFNLDKAQAMLDAEGIDLTGVAVEMLVDTRFPDVTAIAEILKSDWEKLGLVVTLVPGEDVFDRYMAGDFTVLPSITASGNRYPLAGFAGSITRPENNPAFGLGDAPQEWKEIADKLQRAQSPADEVAAAEHLLDYFIDQAWALAIADRSSVVAQSKRVVGFEFTIDTMPVFQRVKLAD
jgi:peptide/nickel transport system substrate-binding protein